MDMLTSNQLVKPLIDFSTLPVGSEKEHLDQVERGAAATLVLAVEEICRRVSLGASQITTPQLLSVTESLHRLSGAAAKKAAQQSAGAGFSVTINIPGANGTPERTITVESSAPTEAPGSPLSCEF
jgi:hypothetical protein